MRIRSFLFLVLLTPVLGKAQNSTTQQQPRQRMVMTDSARAARLAAMRKKYETRVFTHADSLRGTVGPERSWWDVLRYDITIKPEFTTKFTSGNNIITYKVIRKDYPLVMQIDLKQPLEIDSIILNG